MQKNINIPDRIYEGINDLAKSNRRSFSSYVCLILEKHMNYIKNGTYDDSDYLDC